MKAAGEADEDPAKEQYQPWVQEHLVEQLWVQEAIRLRPGPIPVPIAVTVSVKPIEAVWDCRQ